MKKTGLLIAALAAGALALPALASDRVVTNDRTLAPIVDARPGFVIGLEEERRDQVRFGRTTRGHIIGEQGADGRLQLHHSNRARYGAGPDAPSVIYVRVLDTVFAIDPFTRVPEAGAVTADQFFRGGSLQTDRALFTRQRIERVEEAFDLLESARQRWLRQNGYLGVRSVSRDSGVDSSRTVWRVPAGAKSPAVRSAPEPAGWFQRPDSWPRGQSREAVDAGQQRGVVRVVSAG
ncbi:MAG: hypothetical protein AAF356_08655 [Planctomycetota bacterium]